LDNHGITRAEVHDNIYSVISVMPPRSDSLQLMLYPPFGAQILEHLLNFL